MRLEDVIKAPIITEKSMAEAAFGKFTFRVDRRATKSEVSRAVAKFFKVHPLAVRTINIKGRTKWSRGFRKRVRTKAWKKAIVTLKEGEKIEVFDVGEK